MSKSFLVFRVVRGLSQIDQADSLGYFAREEVATEEVAIANEDDELLFIAFEEDGAVTVLNQETGLEFTVSHHTLNKHTIMRVENNEE